MPICELYHKEQPPQAEVLATVALMPAKDQFSGKVLTWWMCREHGNRLAEITLVAGPWLYETWRAYTDLSKI